MAVSRPGEMGHHHRGFVSQPNGFDCLAHAADARVLCKQVLVIERDELLWRGHVRIQDFDDHGTGVRTRGLVVYPRILALVYQFQGLTLGNHNISNPLGSIFHHFNSGVKQCCRMEDVKIPEFGSFVVRDKQARTGRNPNSGGTSRDTSPAHSAPEIREWPESRCISSPCRQQANFEY